VIERDAIALTPIKQTGGKLIHAWAMEGDCDPAAIRSNTFSIEWPPRSGRMRQFPEVDRAEWFGLDDAQERITKGQRGFIDQLRARLPPEGPSSDTRHVVDADTPRHRSEPQ
jgi:predicted NUDIX family NTP pyrophosphohydrolase